MFQIDRKVGESLIIEDPDNGLHYRVVVVKVADGQNARLGIEVLGPDELAVEQTSQAEEPSSAVQLKLSHP